MDITVVGRKKASIPPERATLHLLVGFESGDKADALARTTALVGRLTAHIQSLQGGGVSPITWYAVLPISTRSWRPYSAHGEVKPLRYGAFAQAKVKFRDFTALSAFGQQVGGAAGVTMQYVEWALTEVSRDRLVEELQAGAVADALARARVVARAAGAGGVVPLEIADPGLLSGVRGGGGGPAYDQAVARPAAAFVGGGPGEAEGIELAPEDVMLSAEVHARFTTT